MGVIVGIFRLYHDHRVGGPPSMLGSVLGFPFSREGPNGHVPIFVAKATTKCTAGSDAGPIKLLMSQD